ncbi:hypothetical protein Veis_2948 [Verminephrobacter eiseniae EF01-2]|uniref:Uncharacterized protein n=1 Tax=Verminephrobacter eiseniae (strain EF01-2) TaxID=391735 RepID=A1WM27_VEREI|nr:hypothetical protein Veis_2948 [Verminephrobacter eiseniae EF01-2]
MKPGGQPLRLPARMPQRRESGGNAIGVESIGNVADCGHGHRFRYIDRMAAGVVLKISCVAILQQASAIWFQAHGQEPILRFPMDKPTSSSSQ